MNFQKAPIVFLGSFYQQLVHEVLPIKMSTDSYRTYIGFRLTESNQPLYEHKRTIEDQGVAKSLPPGMPIKMYADLNMVYQLNQLIEWSKNFKDVCLEQKINKKTGETYLIVHQRMKSLKELDFSFIQLMLKLKKNNESTKTQLVIITPTLVQATQNDGLSKRHSRSLAFKYDPLKQIYHKEGPRDLSLWGLVWQLDPTAFPNVTRNTGAE